MTCLNCKQNSTNLLQSACDINPKTTEQRKTRAGWDLIASGLMNFPPALLRINGVYKRTQLQGGCLPVTLVNFDLENTLETVILGFVFITWNSWVSSNTGLNFKASSGEVMLNLCWALKLLGFTFSFMAGGSRLFSGQTLEKGHMKGCVLFMVWRLQIQHFISYF